MRHRAVQQSKVLRLVISVLKLHLRVTMALPSTCRTGQANGKTW